MTARPLRLILDPLLEVLYVGLRLLVPIDGIDLGLDSVKKCERWYIGAHQDLSPHAHDQRVRYEGLGKDGFSNAVVPLVGDDAHDQQPAVSAGRNQTVGRLIAKPGELDRMAHGIVIRKIPAGECLINHKNRRATMVLVLIPDAPLSQGDSQHREILLADK